MISEKVKLSTGKTVTAYHFDAEDRKAFYEHQTKISNLFSRCEALEYNIDLVLTALERDILNFVEGELEKHVGKLDPDKSFRWYELWQDFKYKRYTHDAFDKLLNKGLIVDRGSGWYRINASSGSAEA